MCASCDTTFAPALHNSSVDVSATYCSGVGTSFTTTIRFTPCALPFTDPMRVDHDRGV
ncbi:hypothetical protein Rhow_000096 [Rhodococcus wratislaviensis]|uniref:Uncharacterized protein n=1 Tax=Rhodococcus wratislaviensis TaxID=44752 RepID=A0A402C1Q6_RHOWR|nr:hypothetical protein Rhow_000096 [Rhodococcus wratislaviensis]